MTRWIVLNRHLIHVVWFTVGSVGLAIMMIINIFLLQRLMQSDFSRTQSSSTNPIDTTENSKCGKKDVKNGHFVSNKAN